MSTPRDQADGGDPSDDEHGLEEIQHPMDDPQTRPAIDPEADPPETD